MSRSPAYRSPIARVRPSEDVEVAVVGGGPGGSAIATLLAEAGHDVVVFDRARFPRHKACSEYVNPAGFKILEDLGVAGNVMALGAHRMEAMLVHAPGGQRFLSNFDGVEAGRMAVGLSRYRLDHLLIQRAQEAGARISERSPVRRVLVENGIVNGIEANIGGTTETVRARLVVGADGHHSVVSRSLALDAAPLWPKRTGLIAHYRDVQGLDRWGEMHVGHGGYAGLAPLEDGLTNVAFVADTAAVASRSGSISEFFEAGLHSLPEVARKLDGAERVGGLRGIGPMAGRAKRTAGDGWLLVGDAAYFLDPFTGEGIYAALRAAQLAAPIASGALRAGGVTAEALAPYRAARRRVFTAKGHVCWIVQAFIHHPTLMDYVTARLDRRQELGLTLAGVLGNMHPASRALSPLFLGKLLRP
jgi:geranylgeranyl reductase family protein